MLSIFRSNRAEWLAALIAKQLSIDPPSPFESIEIVVHTWPTSRWLSEQLAIGNGINAQIQFPFPRAYLRKIIRLLLDRNDDNDPWKAKNLVWPILEQLTTFVETKNGIHLREWISKQEHISNQLNKCEWQLARTIADAFDDYILYRPNWVRKWLKMTENEFKISIEKLPSNESWQPQLFRLVSTQINSPPFCQGVEEVILKIRNKELDNKNLPKQLIFFGLSKLAPIQVELIQAISRIVDVQIFLLTPCPDLWKRCGKRKDLLITDWSNPKEINWSIDTPRLESNLGKMGAEFQQLLEGSGDSQFGELLEHNLFASPCHIAKEKKKEPSLLEQIQDNLITQEEQKILLRNKDDTSLLFFACPGTWREIQVIRDQIIQLLANDPSLEPRDILIMTPQIKKFSSLIASVFNDKSATKVQLPWRITDRNNQEEPGLIKFMIELMKIASERLNATSIESLLANQAMQEQKEISQEEINSINFHLQQTGFRWGLDKEERGGDEQHSLEWCLDRWLLGLILPSTPGLSAKGVAPYSEGITIEELKKWWHLLSNLSNQIKILRRSHTCKKWVEILQAILEDIFGDGGSWSFEKQTFLTALEEWRQLAGNCQLKIEGQVVLEVLNESLSINNSRFGHRSGAITISAIEPMRAIPHRVIVLMGIDASIFPATDERPGFHLLDKMHFLGDPKTNQQERYVILEALMSTRQHLLISWNSRDERTGESCPPSNPIQQWLNQLESELSNQDFQGLLREPDPNPLHKSNFIGINNQAPISCDTRNLEARVLIDKNKITRNIALALPLSWDFSPKKQESEISNEKLESWLISPQLVWLENLNIRPKEWTSPIENLEPLSLNELERYKLLKQKLDDLIEDFRSQNTKTLTHSSNGDWEYRTAGQGILPCRSASSIESQLLEERWQNLKSLIFQIGPCRKELIKFDDYSEEIIFAGGYALLIDPVNLKSKNAMKAWLMHLRLSVYSKETKGTILITRQSAKNKKNEYQISLRWNSLNETIAIELLRDLRIMAQKGLKECWPIPPESGWELAITQRENSLKSEKAFIDKWEGTFNVKGECSKDEMYICFGIKCNASLFLESKIFDKAYKYLYSPIIKNLAP